MRNCVPLTSIAMLLALSCHVNAQTQVDLRTQGKSIDFSAASSTRPSKTDTMLPTNCSTGELFFKTDALAGQNLHGCTALNTWTLLGDGGGSGATMAASLGDLNVTKAAADTITIGANCSSSAPCIWHIGSVTFKLTASATATLSGTSASGTAYVYLDTAGQLVVDENTAATLTCNANCVAAATGGFPDTAFRIASATFTANIWDDAGISDERAWFGKDNIEAGSGITTSRNPATGAQTVSTDPNEVPRFFTGTANPPTQNCTAGRDFYVNTALSKAWQCTATNIWTELTGGGGSSYDPTDRNTVLLVEDFMSGRNEGGMIGQLGFSNSGTGGVSWQEGVANHWGIARLASGAASGDQAYLHTAYSSNNSIPSPNSNTNWEVQFVVRLPSIASAGAYLGLANAGNMRGGTSVGIKFDTNDADVNWKCRACHDSTCSSDQDLGVAVSANTWYWLRLRSTAAGTVFCSVNGGTEQAVTTNLPQWPVAPSMLVVTRTSAAKNLDVDFFSLKATVSR